MAKVIEMRAGKWVANALHAAVELGIPDALADGPRTPEQLAEATGTVPQRLEMLLRALATAELLEIDEDGRYALAPPGNFVRSDVPGSIRGFAVLGGRPWYDEAWHQLLEGLRTGRTPMVEAHGEVMDRFIEHSPKDRRAFQSALTGLTTGIAPVLVDVIDPEGAERIVDVGGGQGALLTSLLEAAPDAEGVLLDLPAVAEDAGQIPKEGGVADRCELTGGDFLQSVPADGDLYVLSMIVHNWSDEDNLQILANVREAIGPDGRLIVIDPLVDRTEPGIDALLDLELFVMEGGWLRTADEIDALVSKAGFDVERVAPTPSPFHGIVEATPT